MFCYKRSMVLALARLVYENRGYGPWVLAIIRFCDRKFDFLALARPWSSSFALLKVSSQFEKFRPF